MSTELIEKILHSKKVAYNNLIPLIRPYLDVKNEYQNVNIFVDLHDILKQLYNPQTIDSFTNLKNQERHAISSEIINIVSHYRHFFASRFKKFTTFYFFLSTKPSKYHIELYKDYKKEFYEKRLNLNHPLFSNINKIIFNSFKIIKNIMEFIPNVYFINTGDLESNVVPYYFLNQKNYEDLNIIISNDDLFYQDLLLMDQTLILELRSEKTRIVTKENMYDILLEKTKKSYDDYTHIVPENLPLIQPLISHKNYGIPSIKNMGITRAMDFINKSIDKGYLNSLGNYKNNNSLYEALLKSGLNSEELEQYRINYSLINHSEILDKNYNNYENIISSQLIERVDGEGLRITNERYFQKNPILLDYCFEGENYENEE